VYKQTGIMPVELEKLVSLPPMLKYIWRDFLILNSARTSNGFSANCIPYTEIKAYYDLINVVPEPWEVEVLRHMDNLVMQIMSDKQRQEQSKANKKK